MEVDMLITYRKMKKQRQGWKSPSPRMMGRSGCYRKSRIFLMTRIETLKIQGR